MTVISIATAKKSLSSLIKRAAEGERIEIGAYGRSQVALVASNAEHRGVRFGSLKGKLTVAGDFDAPLPIEILDAFYNDAPYRDEPSGSAPEHPAANRTPSGRGSR